MATNPNVELIVTTITDAPQTPDDLLARHWRDRALSAEAAEDRLRVGIRALIAYGATDPEAVGIIHALGGLLDDTL